MLQLYLISVFTLSKAMENVFICGNSRLDSSNGSLTGIALSSSNPKNGLDHDGNYLQRLYETVEIATTQHQEYVCIRFANLEKIIFSNDGAFIMLSSINAFTAHGLEEYQGTKNEVNANSEAGKQLVMKDTFAYYEQARDRFRIMLSTLAREIRISSFALSYRLRSAMNKVKAVLKAQYWVMDVFVGMKCALFYALMLAGAYLITLFEHTRPQRYQALGLVGGCIYCERLLLSYGIISGNEILWIRLLFGVFIVFILVVAICSFKKGRKVPSEVRHSTEDIWKDEYISMEDIMQESISVKSESEFSAGH